ncbi:MULTISPECIES: HAMP domain-containing sensor histidine kinase [Streptomyces]|uniref:sensor histidine kinase n=1 Tax=Streptomyces TaxID=1883 RepID=UPI0004C668BB|nr:MULTISPECIES: HAMP domain-containing sensor histidine kinase [Streptomyces]MBD3543941.1 HAMP domain-containing histidine kinase [Streptomyces sp. JV180]MBD3551653.1 HAMP domain-containing histidine kinase [Streptomyces sp. SP18CM02]NEC44201.1 HAMP domain-containing histidine kinase [Streptomyces sp. SID8016]
MAGPVTRRSPARRRLRRLQLRLTAAYTLITVVGLACLSWLVIRTDDRARQDAEYDEMRRRASVAASLVYYEDGRIRLDGLHDDEATAGTPQILVLEGRPGADPVTVFRGRAAPFAVPAGPVAAVARAAMADEGPARADARDRSGRPVRLLGVPFHHDATDEVAGAAVAVGDPERGADEHRSLVLSLVVGAGALTALAALTGHVLSGRSMRPAWEALEQQERLLADAAHELRTPVAVMRGSVELAAGAPGGLDAHLPRIRRAAERMSDVVENLLTRGRLEAAVDAVRAEPLRLDQLVEEVCAELPESAPRPRLRLAESVVEADAALVRVAVRNLLDNAVRHGRAAEAPEGDGLLVTVRGPEVAVADRGPGVDPARLPELTERFRSPGGGTGIGLSLVRRVAEAHRGMLAVRARPGGGAEFVLRLAPARPRRGSRGGPHDSLMIGRS